MTCTRTPPAARATRRRWQTISSIASASSGHRHTSPNAWSTWSGSVSIMSSSSATVATLRRTSSPGPVAASVRRSFRRSTMPFRKLGASGLQVSAVGLGCNPFGNEVDPPTAQQVVARALDLGVTYFDTADSYNAGRSEEYLGQALSALGCRDRVIVATKFGNRVGPGPNDGGASRSHILRSCEASLKRLRTDYIDLYQVHTPDRSTSIEESLDALNALVQ